MARFFASAGAAGFALFGLLGCSAKASPYKSVVLCDFERVSDSASEDPHYDIPTALKRPNYINHDFRWNTSGYAAMEPIGKEVAKAEKNKPFYKFFEGKTAAKVRFTVPADYKKADAASQPKRWESGLSLATDSYTPLQVTDWSPYAYLAMSAYNPGKLDQTLRLRFNDSAADVTETSVLLPAGKPVTVEVDLKRLSAARLNTKDLRGLTLYLDTAGQKEDPILIFDNLGLHTGSYAERKKAESEEEVAEEEEADWDSEDEEGAKKDLGLVSKPEGLSGTAAAAGASGTAAP